MNPYYKDYGEYLSEKFPGIKVQKLSVNAGFSCPNRDGTIGRGGCIYCDNTSFTPGYCFGSDSVSKQLEEGKKFFSRKYPSMKFLAYFQSFTNTFAFNGGDKRKSVSSLARLYNEALSVDGVIGLIIGSRPDCFPDEVVTLLAELNRNVKVFVEIGAETSFNTTLDLINRGHSWEQTCDAVQRLYGAGLPVGLHLICGLPGENDEMCVETVKKACELPIDSIKFHHLQVIRDTPLHRRLEGKEIRVEPFTLEGYLSLCERLVKIVPRQIAIERFLASSPQEKVIAPKWGIKNFEFTNLLINRLKTKS